jgi:hypothetical protein
VKIALNTQQPSARTALLYRQYISSDWHQFLCIVCGLVPLESVVSCEIERVKFTKMWKNNILQNVSK